MNGSRIIVIIGLLTGSVGLIMPEPWRDRCRSGVRDLIAPGSAFVADRCRWPSAGGASSDPETIAQLESELRTLRRRARAEEVTGILAEPEPQRTASLIEPPPLLESRLIRARVIGRERDRIERAGVIVDVGSGAGLRSDGLVIDEEILIDQGENMALRPGSAVLAGVRILGKLETVGRRTSRVRLITQVGYTGRATILRGDGTDAVAAADGLLTGTGKDHCELTHLPTSAKVRVGDRVYSTETHPTEEGWLFYGTVRRAERDPLTREWRVEVDPGSRRTPLGSVVVLDQQPHPARTVSDPFAN